MSQAPQPPTEPPGPPPTGEPPGDSPEGGGSRNVWLTLGVVGGVIALAVVLFLVLRPDDDDDAPDTTAAVATTTVETTTEATTEATTEVTTTVETTTETAPTTTPEDQPVRVNVRFANGEVVGGLVEAEIERRSQVVLTVRADVVDEVHLHGYNLYADVAPGQPGRITFRAVDAGEFEAELEALGIPVAELTVTP